VARGRLFVPLPSRERGIGRDSIYMGRERDAKYCVLIIVQLF